MTGGLTNSKWQWSMQCALLQPACPSTISSAVRTTAAAELCMQDSPAGEREGAYHMAKKRHCKYIYRGRHGACNHKQAHPFSVTGLENRTLGGNANACSSPEKADLTMHELYCRAIHCSDILNVQLLHTSQPLTNCPRYEPWKSAQARLSSKCRNGDNVTALRSTSTRQVTPKGRLCSLV